MNTDIDILYRLLHKYDIRSLIERIFQMNETTEVNNINYIDILFLIDPPLPIPLTRSIVINNDLPILNHDFSTRLDKLRNTNQREFIMTEFKLIENDICEIYLHKGDLYINYIMRINKDYYKGTLLVPYTLDGNLDNIIIYKELIYSNS